MPCSLTTPIVQNNAWIVLLQSPFVIDISARHLRSFLAVADELHFGRAAERLGIGQSAVSQQVRRLEVAVGTELLTRTSRHVALTPAGDEMLRGAQRFLADLDRTAVRAHAAAAGRAGTRRAALQVGDDPLGTAAHLLAGGGQSDAAAGARQQLEV